MSSTAFTNPHGQRKVGEQARAQKEIFVQAIKRGQDLENLLEGVNDRGPWNIRILHLASAIGNSDKLEMLLRSLHNSGNKSLIEVQVYPESQVWAEFTPLHVAVRYNRLEAVNLLLGFGANLNSVAAKTTPLHLAHNLGHKRILDVLLSRIDKTCAKNCVSRHMVTHLHLACSRGNSRAAKFLINAGAKLEDRIPSKAPTWKKLRPLGVAVRYGQLRVTQLLISRGADRRHISIEARCIIHKRSHKIIEQLVRSGHFKVDTKSIFPNYETLLQYACSRGYVGLTKVLLRLFSPVNHSWDCNATPLRLAIANGHEFIVKLLLAKGANPRATIPGGYDVLDALVGMNVNFDRRSSNLKEQRLDSPKKIYRYYIRMIDAFLEAGMNLEDLNRALRNSLGNAASTYALLESGADINAVDRFGNVALWHHMHGKTPLTHAVFIVFRRHLRRLSVVGVRVNQQNLQLCFLYEIRLQPFEIPEKEVDMLPARGKEEELMKTKFVDKKKSTTFYDFLFKSPEELARTVSFQTIQEIFNSYKFYKEFRLYGFLLRQQYVRLMKLSQMNEPMEH